MANQNYTTPFTIVTDPLHIFDRGAEFERQDMTWTLWTASWPDGLVVRDTADDWRYRVVAFETRSVNGTFTHQRLESLCGTRMLEPRGNGSMREVAL